MPEIKSLGLPVSRRMRGLVYMASRVKFDVDTFNKDIQYPWKNKESRKLALKEKQNRILKAKDTRALGTSLSIIPELRVLVLTKRHVGSRNEIDNHNSLRLVKKVIASPYNVIFC